MIVELKILPGGEGLELPSYETALSAGADLRLAQDMRLAPGERGLAPCGFAMALPEGFEGQVRPRSGLAVKHGLTVINAPGTIDADYRGEVKVPLINLGQDTLDLQRGERIAQLVIAPVIQGQFQSVETLSKTARGTGGFGSTGV